ncbi:MAG: hypothetical protein ACLGJC_07420 [Alphaproteobacteria bacterium]
MIVGHDAAGAFWLDAMRLWSTEDSTATALRVKVESSKPFNAQRNDRSLDGRHAFAMPTMVGEGPVAVQQDYPFEEVLEGATARPQVTERDVTKSRTTTC